MKKIVFLIVVLNLISGVAFADSWDDYKKFMERFYLLDNQKFDSITCNITVSTLNLDSIKQQLKPMEKNIKINESLSEFTVTVSRDTGPVFHDPLFDIQIVSDEEIRDKKMFEKGMGMVKSGVEMQVVGVKVIILGVLFESKMPQKENRKNIRFVQTKNQTVIEYEKKGTNIKEIHQNNTKTLSEKSATTTVESKSTFRELAGKLVYDSTEANLSDNEQKIQMSTSVEYQDIKGVKFPSKILSKTKLETANFKQDGTFEVYLNKCVLK